MNPTWLYVAAVYAAAVWLTRRGGIELPWRIAAFFYALVLLFLWRPMTGPYVGFPADFVTRLPPWYHMTRLVHVGNYDLNDVPLQMVPWAHQVREAWKSLHIPLWNAAAGSGYPLMANGQSAAFSLLRFIALPLPLAYSITAEAAMKILLALTFTWLYCRRRGYGELPSAIGAVSFGFGLFMTVWLNFPHATVACLLPAVFYALDLLLEQITYARIVFAAAVWVIILFGGHPESAAHIFLIAGLYVLWVALVQRPLDRRTTVRLLLALSAALFIATVIASPLLAPLGEALPHSKRVNELKASPADIPPFGTGEFIVLFAPRYFGSNMPYAVPWGPENAETVTGFSGILGLVSWILLLIRALQTRQFRTFEFFLVVASLLIFGTIANWPILSTVLLWVLKFAANARLRLVFGFLLALQAAAAVDLLTRLRHESKGVTVPFLLAALAVTAAMISLTYPFEFNLNWHLDTGAVELFPAMLVLAAGAILAITRGHRAAAMLLLVAVIAEVFTAGNEWNTPVSIHHFYAKTPLIRKLEALRDATPKNQPFRIVGGAATLFPNTGAIYGFEDVRAHDPMANARYLMFLQLTAGYDPYAYFAHWTNDTLDARVLDLLNVRYVVTDVGMEMKDRQRFTPVYEGRDGIIYENHDALPRFFAPPYVVLDFNRAKFPARLAAMKDWGSIVNLARLPVENDRERTDLLASRPANSPVSTVKIVEASPTRYRLHVVAPRYAVIASSVPTWAGWHVSVDGREIDPLVVNGAFVGFVVRPGTHEAEVWFAPLSFRLGAIAAILMLIALAALSRESLRRRLLPAAARG